MKKIGAAMIFYYFPASSPCRGALLTARALELQLTLKEVNLQNKEQLRPEFTAMNPQHCVPTLVDGTLTLWESRAISCYFVNRYGVDDSLYPRDAIARAAVDKMLYFDMGTLYQRFSDYAYPVLFRKASPERGRLEKVHEALRLLNAALESHCFAAGDNVTIADHALAASVATIAASGLNVEKHVNVNEWLARCRQTLPGYEENERGAQQFGGLVKPLLL